MTDDASPADTDDGQGRGEYRVLARKYRPSSFEGLIGQEPMVRTLSNAFTTGRIAQAYMLTGVRGVGKTTTARILARALNYESDIVSQPTLDLVENGVHCLDIMEGRHVDVVEMDAASHTGIGDIREIIASVAYKPQSARYKVYIIDEIHMLSNQAFNGLLKTLEEPPEHVKFIFATTEIRKVPITVLSRCQRFDLRRIDAAELTRHLQAVAGHEKVDVEPEALAMIARAGEGSARDALSLLDQAIAHAAGGEDHTVLADDVQRMLGLSDRARIIDLFETLMKGDAAAALDELKDQYDAGADPATILVDLATFVHFVTRLRYVDSAVNDPTLSETEKTRGKQFSEALSPRVLGRTWQMLLKGVDEVQASPRPLAAADMVLLRIAHAADLPTPDEVIRTLHQAESGERSAPALNPSDAPQPQSAPPALRSASGSAVAAAPQAEPESATVQAGPDQGPVLRAVHDEIVNFEDLLGVAEKKRDIRFKLMLRNNFSPILFEPGRIVFAAVGDAPRDMVPIMQARLREWTGAAWSVEVQDSGGRETVKQTESREREQHLADAEADPVVAAVLKAFPKSKIVDVRFPNAEGRDGLDEQAALNAGLENPDDEAEGVSVEADDPGAGGLDDYF